jgi:REP element-mobilizing transposase RayT
MSKGGLFRNRYRNDTARWQKWDYGAAGAYFITICTKNRVHYFGSISIGLRNIVDTVETCGVVGTHLSQVGTQNIASQRMTEIGKSAQDCWYEIPNHFPFVKLDEFVVMPNHVHGIIWIVGTENFPSLREWKTNQFGPQSCNIPSIVRGYKIGVTKFANAGHIPFAWQPRYYDHVIRDEIELERIRIYIKNNPMKWKEDKFFNAEI